MTREQLAHLLRAASSISGDLEILVIGSQSILGSYSETELPERAIVSMEADLAFHDSSEGSEHKADAIDGAIGEMSSFQETHGYYAQGVSETTAVLPEGWQSRLVRFERPDALPGLGLCLEPHDLVISKLVAQREKDMAFTTALLEAGLLNVTVLEERAHLIHRPRAVVNRVIRSLRICLRHSLKADSKG